jgi:hypothetical protein
MQSDLHHAAAGLQAAVLGSAGASRVLSQRPETYAAIMVTTITARK